MTNMYIAAARLLYCFDLLADGEIDVSAAPLPLEFAEAPCKVKIRVRSQAHAELIERTCGDVALVD